jgi:hypothetical protein
MLSDGRTAAFSFRIPRYYSRLLSELQTAWSTIKLSPRPHAHTSATPYGAVPVAARHVTTVRALGYFQSSAPYHLIRKVETLAGTSCICPYIVLSCPRWFVLVRNGRTRRAMFNTHGLWI